MHFWMSLLLALLVSLLFSQPIRASDISKCSMVAEGRAEVVVIETELDDARAVSVSGILLKPAGKGPFAAVLILPGTGGLVTPYCHGVLAERFIRWGYAALIVASTTAHDKDGNRLFEFSFADQANQARGAVQTLAGLSDVDQERVAVWGFSRGGATAIELSTSRRDRARRFRAIVAAAPPCSSKIAVPHTPLLVIIGTDDELLSAKACKDFAAKLKGERDFDFLLLPGARHVFWMDPAADEVSSRRMREFLKSHL